MEPNPTQFFTIRFVAQWICFSAALVAVGGILYICASGPNILASRTIPQALPESPRLPERWHLTGMPYPWGRPALALSAVPFLPL